MHRMTRSASGLSSRGSSGRSVGRALEELVRTWIGWSLPPAERAIAESGWQPDEPAAWCPRCGGSVGEDEVNIEAAKGCASCRDGSAVADLVVRLGAYRPPLSHLVAATKYQRWSEMAEALGTRLAAAVRRAGALRHGQPTIIVPIPMPLARRVYRGIDHAREIAEAAGRVLGVEVHTVLAKGNGHPQTGMTRTDRRRSRGEWMRVRRRVGGWPLEGMDVILIDDVRTTGTTLRTAGRLVGGLGADRVIAAVVAVTDDPARRSRAAGSTLKESPSPSDFSARAGAVVPAAGESGGEGRRRADSERQGVPEEKEGGAAEGGS
jgi:ComF family protein